MAGIDYLVASLQPLSFDGKAPYTLARFRELVGDVELPAEWTDLETQLRNVLAEARGGAKWKRPASGCSLYWRSRMAAAMQEKDVLARENAVDRVWWDAADELTPPAAPLSKGALQTYFLRLKIVLKRNALAAAKGNEIFDKLTEETKRK